MKNKYKNSSTKATIYLNFCEEFTYTFRFHDNSIKD